MLLGQLRKQGYKLSGSWPYFEFKGQILLIKSVTLVRFVETDVYLVEKQTVIMQLLYVTRWERELVTFCFIKGACTTLHVGEKV